METPPSHPNAAQPPRLSIEAARHLLELALEPPSSVAGCAVKAAAYPRFMTSIRQSGNEPPPSGPHRSL